MLVVENLTKEFKNVTAVDNISFKVEEGKIFGMLGPNGAGKTTTIRTSRLLPIGLRWTSCAVIKFIKT